MVDFLIGKVGKRCGAGVKKAECPVPTEGHEPNFSLHMWHELKWLGMRKTYKPPRYGMILK